MPTVGQKEEVGTGWEEPSPESIRRRMEIDDGTAAWGDPGKYSGGSVNMWNRNGQSDQEAMGPSSQHQPHPTHSSKHPPQTMQPIAQDKGSSSGMLLYVCIEPFIFETKSNQINWPHLLNSLVYEESMLCKAQMLNK